MKQPSVLIISDDKEFAQTLMARWQAERNVPTMTVLSSNLWNSANPAGDEVVILGAVPHEHVVSILAEVDPSSVPTVCVTSDEKSLRTLQGLHSRLILIPQREGWRDTLIQVCSEAFRRMEAVERAQRAERISAASRAHATLGRYVLEMYHSLNNALTSVLGNADLLLLEPGQFSAEAREQIETIHTMALRLHEIVQRFSSLATEMELTEKESQSETKSPRKALISDS